MLVSCHSVSTICSSTNWCSVVVSPATSKIRTICNTQWRTQEFCSGGGSTNSDEDRGQKERGSEGGIPLVKGSGGSCNLVQEISFHIVKFS